MESNYRKMLEINKIHQGDCLEKLKEIEDNITKCLEVLE